MKNFNKNRLGWCLIDCVQKQRFDVTEFPYAIGSSGYCNLEIDGNGDVVLLKRNPDEEVLLSGIPMADMEPLQSNTDYSIKVDGDFYLLRGDTDLKKWIERLNFENWIIQDIATGERFTGVPFLELPAYAVKMGLTGYDFIATVEGAEQAFYLKDVFPKGGGGASPPLAVEAWDPEKTDEERNKIPYDGEKEAFDINALSGEFTCPHCWRHFDRGDVMWVAKHRDLRDPDLGLDYPLRFFPTSFDELGGVLDGMGERCSEMACPNCKSKLPTRFLDFETSIFSIIGAPSAGKSYFLTSMIKKLEEVFPRSFGWSFQDSDLPGNAIVSEMRANLFSDSTDPIDLTLDKLSEVGDMFKKWKINGYQKNLPKPFSYRVSRYLEEQQENCSFHLIFYDNNAGEQFEPSERVEGVGTSVVDSIEHLASSAAIFFLFDPASDSGFQKMLKDSKDPQLSSSQYLRLNRQDNIISEMRNRIKSELNIDANERISTPLAMIIGKCDLWSKLLPEPLIDPVTDAGLDLDAIETNSANIRDFLLRVSPSVLANAEAISHEVVYFPVSPIGHSPQLFVSSDGGEESIGPVPGKVNPLYAEVPVIWSLVKSHPEEFKSYRGKIVGA